MHRFILHVENSFETEKSVLVFLIENREKNVSFDENKKKAVNSRPRK